MKRKPHEPYLDRGVKGWIMHTAVRNFWRVAPFYELEDLVADGYLAYVICKNRYAAKVENRAHFMSLFKRVYLSIIIDMANKRTRYEECGLGEVKVQDMLPDYDQTSALAALAGGEEGEAELIYRMKDVSGELKEFLSDLHEGYFLGRVHRRKRNGARETNNEFYNRLMKTSDYDYEGELRRLVA